MLIVDFWLSLLSLASPPTPLRSSCHCYHVAVCRCYKLITHTNTRTETVPISRSMLPGWPPHKTPPATNNTNIGATHFPAPRATTTTLVWCCQEHTLASKADNIKVKSFCLATADEGQGASFSLSTATRSPHQQRHRHLMSCLDTNTQTSTDSLSCLNDDANINPPRIPLKVSPPACLPMSLPTSRLLTPAWNEWVLRGALAPRPQGTTRAQPATC